MADLEQHYFDCACSDFNHVVRFTFDPDDGEVYIDVRLNGYEPWYKRIWIALKYVFNRPIAYGHYDVTLLREEDFPRLHALCDRAEAVIRSQRLKDVPAQLSEKPLLKG